MHTHKIEIAKDSSSIKACFPAFKELRPHLQDAETFQEAVLRQRGQGYTIAYIKDEEGVAACIGYRVFDMLAWGKVLYIDDLITCESSRGKGYWSVLLSHALSEGKSLECDEVHLDTGYTRHDAHRAYLKQGFQLNCHHLALRLNKGNA